MCLCWELLPPISSKPFFEQAADSSLDYYLDFHSFTERHLSSVLSLRLYLLPARYSSFSGIVLFTLPGAPSVQPEASASSSSQCLHTPAAWFAVIVYTCTTLTCVCVAVKEAEAAAAPRRRRRWCWRRAAGRGRCGRVVKSVVKRATGSCS